MSLCKKKKNLKIHLKILFKFPKFLVTKQMFLFSLNGFYGATFWQPLEIQHKLKSK
jgi:hypothetical protein